MAVDRVEEKRESKAEDGSSEERREYGDLLPTDLDPRIDEEADSKNNKCYEA